MARKWWEHETEEEKQKKRGIGGRALADIRSIVSSLTPSKLIPFIGEEARAAVGLDVAAKKTRATKMALAAKSKTPARAQLAETLMYPGIRLIPGTYVGHELARQGGGPGALLEHPVYTLLDVLPFISKASRLATVPSKAAKPTGAIRTAGAGVTKKAATRYTGLGKEAKAAEVLERGLDPRQLVGELTRTAEEKIFTGKRAPYAPSRLLEVSGFGGRRAREVMRSIGIEERQLVNAARDYSDAVAQDAKDLGISLARQREILALGQRAPSGIPGIFPDWRGRLAPNERTWLTRLETKVDDITQYWVGKGKLVQVGGETYSASSHPFLAKAVRKAEGYGRHALAAQQPVGKGSKRPPGTYLKRTTAQWQAMRVKALAEAEQLASRSTPARFKPVQIGRVKQAASRLAKGRLDEIDIERVVEGALSGNFTFATSVMARGDVALLRRITKDIKGSWQGLRALGFDPIFSHTVPADVARRLIVSPKLLRKVAPSFTKEISWNMSPHVQDLSVSLSSMAIEHLQHLHYSKLIEHLSSRKWLLNRIEMDNQVAAMVRGGAGKGQDIASRLDDVRQRFFTSFDPDSIFPLRRAGIQLPAKGGFYLPKGLEKNLAKVVKQADLTKAARLAAVPLNIFRFSILSLSPFYYLDNIVSGAFMLAAHHPRDLLQLRNAYRMLRRREVPPEISRGARFETVETAAQARKFQNGRDIGAALEDAGKVSLPTKVGQAAASVPRGLRAAAGAIDDMYKVMGYLGEVRRGAKKGLSKELAHQRGIELAHKILVDLDRLTPVERTIIRSMVPFYSWTQHILRYVMSYPFDHPWRAAIVSAVSRQISEEWPAELPERFKTDLFFAGDTKRIGLAGPMPWMTVPDILTVEGFLSRLNPALQSYAELTGADPYSMTAPVYGARDTRYDPISGREVAVRPSIVGKVLETLSPQVQYLWNEISDDPQWQRFVQENPEAARAAAFKAFGIRIPRDVNIQEEIAKAQKAKQRQEAREKRREAEKAKLPVEAPSGGGKEWWNH